MKNRLYLSLVVVALLCLAGWTGFAQGQRSNPARQTWEYTVCLYNHPSCSLETLGAQGWELIIVSESTYYLKRAR